MDKSKLIKFLNLSSSSNDGEALSAIQKANEFLKENNTNWTDLFNKSVVKELKEDYNILHMNLLKEISYSQELKNYIRSLKKVIKYLILIIIVLVIVVIFK